MIKKKFFLRETIVVTLKGPTERYANCDNRCDIYTHRGKFQGITVSTPGSIS